MQISLSKEAKEALESLRIGTLHFKSKVETAPNGLWEKISALTSTVSSTVKLDHVNKIPAINDTRIAYKKMGKDPNRYRPSADSLNRRVVKGNGLYKVNNVVDCLNYISLKSGFSIGGYNISKIKGSVVLSKGNASDVYYGIGRGKLNIENLPVLRDDIGVFGSPTSDSERTMINEQTREVGFYFFDFGFNENLESYMEESSQLIQEFANGCDLETAIFEL